MIRSTKSVLRFVLLLAVALLAIPASARAQAEDPAAAQPAEQEPAPRNGEFAFGGPIELQDVFLPAQMRPQSYPESAEVLPPGAFSVRTVVDWTNHLAQTDRYLFDGESVSTVLKLRYAPWQRVEVGIDVPYTNRLDGTLDPFIEDVEGALNQEVQARFELPQSNWTALAVRADGSRTLRMLDNDGFGDISLRGKFALARKAEIGFDAALVASLGLPSGGDTMGGEGVSPGLALHAQLPFETVNLFGGGAMQYYSDATEQQFRSARPRRCSADASLILLCRRIPLLPAMANHARDHRRRELRHDRKSQLQRRLVPFRARLAFRELIGGRRVCGIRCVAG